jgi:hypothetical protein
MKYILTTLKTYNDYVKDNNTDKLSDYYKLHTPVINKYLKINEIFDKELNLDRNKDFFIQKYISSNGYENYIYYFNVNNIEYRLYFVFFKNDEKENNIELNNKIFISVSFGLKESNDVTYDNLTNKHEQYKVINYVISLIKLFKNNIDENKYVFMFGNPKDSRKLDIYEFIIVKYFPDYKIIKDKTSAFPNTNIGYYLLK